MLHAALRLVYLLDRLQVFLNLGGWGGGLDYFVVVFEVRGRVAKGLADNLLLGIYFIH